MAKNIFSSSVLKSTVQKHGVIDIDNIVKNSDDFKKEIRKVFQQANRRIQNVTKAGYASPAVKAIIAEKGQRNYTYFSLAGLNPANPADWEVIKYEVGLAKSFLANPTSSATGARQYIKYNQERLGINSFENANKVVDIATQPNINEWGDVNIMQYGALLDNLASDIIQEQREIDFNSPTFAQELEEKLNEVARKMASNGDYLAFLDRYY